MAGSSVFAGRVRATRAVSSGEGGMIIDMRAQMRVIEGNLDKAINSIQGATVGAAREALKPIFDESQRLVPVDTGRLKRSGELSVKRTGGTIVAKIGYGREGKHIVDYATKVHEVLTFRHAAPTQAKFLEQPLLAQMSLIPGRMAEHIKKNSVLAGGGKGG